MPSLICPPNKGLVPGIYLLGATNPSGSVKSCASSALLGW